MYTSAGPVWGPSSTFISSEVASYKTKCLSALRIFAAPLWVTSSSNPIESDAPFRATIEQMWRTKARHAEFNLPGVTDKQILNLGPLGYVMSSGMAGPVNSENEPQNLDVLICAPALVLEE